MLKEERNEKDMELWRKLFESEITYIQTRQKFLNHSTNRVAMIEKALHNPAERGTALRLIEYFTTEECQSLFDDLVNLASVSHSDIELARKAILYLPKSWLLSNIENSAELLLKEGTDEEYRRLLELYIHIDKELTQRLVNQALNHTDPDIQEVGSDFQMREILFYRTDSDSCPVEEFLDSLSVKQAQKLLWVLRLIQEVDPVPSNYFKKLVSTDDIWEVRNNQGNNTFRLLGFFDKDKLVILTNGFAKKTQKEKVPSQEIYLAKQRKRDYLSRRQNNE